MITTRNVTVRAVAQLTPSLLAGGGSVCALTSLPRTAQVDARWTFELKLSRIVSAKNRVMYLTFSGVLSVQNRHALLTEVAAHGSLGHRVASKGVSLVGGRRRLNNGGIKDCRKNDCSRLVHAFFVWEAVGIYDWTAAYKTRTACASTHQRGRLNKRTREQRG